MPETDAPIPNAPAPPSHDPRGLKAAQISCTRGLPDWLLSQNISLAFTSYQSGRLYLAGVNSQGQLALHEVLVSRAMGLYADPQRLVLATLNQIWRFENILAPGPHPGEPDRHYVPRVAHTTGDLDVHDIGVMADGQIVFVNTLFSCLAVLSPVHSFRPIWQPPFISRLAPEDRCHLNGLAMLDGRPAFVTATSRSDIVNGWRARRAEGGCLIDVAANRIVSENLSMPHSPRWHQNQLWVLNSGSGHLGTIDPGTGSFAAVAFCPGFLRGLAFHKHFAIVALSLPRDGAFSGLSLDAELGKRDADPWCGIQIIDTRTGDIVQWLRLQGPVSELFDVSVLPGVRWPTATAQSSDEINRLFSIEGG